MYFLEGTSVYRTRYIYKHLERCLNDRISFGICRFGNAEVTTIQDNEMLPIRSVSQGIPMKNLSDVLDIFRLSANVCDYVASMSVYFSPDYFDMHISRHDEYRKCEEILTSFGVTNKKYCNPDVGYLLFLEGEYNLWNLIRNKRICLLTSLDKTYKVLQKQRLDVSKIDVTPQTTRTQYKANGRKYETLSGRWHWHEYESIKNSIKDSIDDYDIFLIGAGYLAKGYSSYIKELGGISLDVGKVMNTWAGEGFFRLNDFLENSGEPLTFKLTERGNEYRERF